MEEEDLVGGVVVGCNDGDGIERDDDNSIDDDDGGGGGGGVVAARLLRVAFAGNSILYYNDVPKMLQRVLLSETTATESAAAAAAADDDEAPSSSSSSNSRRCRCRPSAAAAAEAAVRDVYQDSCLRGGASLSSLWRDGNGMELKFRRRRRRREDDGGKKKTKKADADGRTATSRNDDDDDDDGDDDIGSPTVRQLLLTCPPTSASSKTPSPTNGGGGGGGRRRRCCCWDYVVLNDNTLSTLRPDAKAETERALRELYAPAIRRQALEAAAAAAARRAHAATTTAITTRVVLVETAAYRGVKDGARDVSHLVDNFDDFADRVRDGYRDYASCLRRALLPERQGELPTGVSEKEPSEKEAVAATATRTTVKQQPKFEVTVAPFGQAVRRLRSENPALWRRLYCRDGVHCTPLGTWLLICVLRLTMARTAPSLSGCRCGGGNSAGTDKVNNGIADEQMLLLRHYDPNWWKESCRYMAGDTISDTSESHRDGVEDRDERHIPTLEEAMELRDAAFRVVFGCGGSRGGQGS